MKNCTYLKYSGSTPGADSNTYTLFSTVAQTGMGARFFAEHGLQTMGLDLTYATAGTLKGYKSVDRGSNWVQVSEHLVLPPNSTRQHEG